MQITQNFCFRKYHHTRGVRKPRGDTSSKLLKNIKKRNKKLPTQRVSK